MMDTNLATILGSAVLLSLFHGMIPSHWMPFVVMGRDRGWNVGRTVRVAFVGGVAHLTSTVMIGVAIGVAGYALSLRYEAIMRWGAPAILIAFGLWVLFRGHSHHHVGCEEVHAHSPEEAQPHHHHHSHLDTRDVATIGALCAVMFLSPCIELEVFYTVAAHRGWIGILSVSVIYMVVTVGVMMTFVGLAARGLETVRWAFLARHERKLSGGLLIALGVVWLAFPL